MNDLREKKVNRKYTETHGAHIIAVVMAKGTLDWLKDTKIFNQKEVYTLTQMLDSPDWDNANLAMELIKTRLNGDSI